MTHTPNKIKAAHQAAMDVWLVSGRKCTVREVEKYFPQVIRSLDKAEREWLRECIQHVQDRLDYYDYHSAVQGFDGKQYDRRKQLPKT